jgi:hypothetical protein
MYFPMRFESVIAPPLALWLASSLHVWRRPLRASLVATLLLLGVLASYLGISDHLRRPLDPYREAALAAANYDPSVPLVASGYCYLETVIAAARPVLAFPPDQGLHPGWRGRYTPADLVAAGRSLPPGAFLFVAESRTPEVLAMSRLRPLQPIYRNASAIVILVRPRS